jgi:hypothetical protein
MSRAPAANMRSPSCLPICAVGSPLPDVCRASCAGRRATRPSCDQMQRAPAEMSVRSNGHLASAFERALAGPAPPSPPPRWPRDSARARDFIRPAGAVSRLPARPAPLPDTSRWARQLGDAIRPSPGASIRRPRARWRRMPFVQFAQPGVEIAAHGFDRRSGRSIGATARRGAENWFRPSAPGADRPRSCRLTRHRGIFALRNGGQHQAGGKTPSADPSGCAPPGRRAHRAGPLRSLW